MKRLGLSTLILVGVVMAIVRERGAAPRDQTAEDEADVSASIARTPAAEAPSAVTKVSAKPSVAPAPFAYPRELESYRVLASKVFLTEDEKKERATLLHDARVLKAAAKRVLTPVASDPSITREQDIGLALLLDARRAGDPVATAALSEVIKDGQVEDVTLARDVREQLAGLKAQVMYEWAAQSPDDAARLAAMLPGPVSQRLWANVQSRQSANLAESSAEKSEAAH